MAITTNVSQDDASQGKKRRSNKRESNPRLANLRGQITESHFNRYIAHDMAGYLRHVKRGGVKLYSDIELEELKEAGVSDRLPPRATAHYMELASKSEAITNLIKARPEETEDLSGEKDPSNQLKYSPVPGLLHKYELVLLYVVRTCSSWCRYCYRSDFLTNKTDKDIGTMSEILEYIRSYNDRVKRGCSIENVDEAFIHGDEAQFPIREALLSGGDPMVLSNRNLFGYLDGLAECGIRTIRIGTKELAFFPQRFDDNFFAMIDLFHELHPDVNLAFMTHFSHPDELLLKNNNGQYVRTRGYHYTRIPVTERAIQRLRSRHYITLENQTPIIDSVNDNAASLRRLHVELKRIGINNHYFFQCREIEGHRTFAVPVEKAWALHRDAQKGLSGIEKSRFSMSTESGKMEVVSVIDGITLEALGSALPERVKAAMLEALGDGLVVLKMHRTPQTNLQSDLIIARRNPEALWITGYEDRILYDCRKEGKERYAGLNTLLESFFPQGAEDKDVESLVTTAANMLTAAT